MIPLATMSLPAVCTTYPAKPLLPLRLVRWTANGAKGWNTWIPYTLGGLKITSWILVALLLAGVTGLLRKT